jgi:chitinase
MNMGMAFYGRSVTRASSSCTEPDCTYLSAGNKGACSDTAGVLFNNEIQQIINNKEVIPTMYKDATVKTLTWDKDQWVSCDDEDTWKLKAEFAKSECLVH